MNIVKGNFNKESFLHRGWIMGHFMEDGSPFKTGNVEIKWGVHKAGEQKEITASNNEAMSLTILVHGKFTLFFPEQKITLEKEGDYCFFLRGYTSQMDC